MVFVNGCEMHALGKWLELQKIRAGMQYMIQSLIFANEEAGSQRGKANWLKGQAW